jgi:hypothetical protein
MQRFLAAVRSKFTYSPFDAAGSDLVSKSPSEGGGGSSGSNSGEVIGLLISLTYP